MTALQSPIRYILSVLCLTFFFCTIVFAQDKVDLEIKVQTASETARGGETFSYTVTVSNIGSAKATDVIFIQDDPKIASFVSNVPTKGNCKVDGENWSVNRVLRCNLGDMEAGESIVTVIELKIHDFGGEEVSENPAISDSIKNMNESMERLGINTKTDSKGTSIGDVDVSAEEEEENRENNRSEVFAELLPSKNIPPRVEIITPKEETVITRSAKKLSKVTFTIKAFDPDGKIEKVFVNTQQFHISVQYPENRIIIQGKSYSIKEFEENKELQKYIGGEATQVGKDTYTFTLENPMYGHNSIFVEATDNGKRSGSTSVRFRVKGDNSIEFTNPLNGSIIKPNTNVLLETKTNLNDGGSGKFELIGNVVCCGTPPLMKQISRNGNSYIHQYLWKNIKKGYYNFQIFLTEDSGALTYSESLQFKVTEKPTVKITSIKNGQTFKQGEEIPIEIEAIDLDGTIEKVSISVNEKYNQKFSWRQGAYKKSGYISNLWKGIYKIKAKATDDMEVEVESESITIIIN